MNIELIRKQLLELTTLIENWSQASEVSAIERDIALDRVKSLYEELRFAQSLNIQPIVSAAPTIAQSGEEIETKAAETEEETDEEELREIEVEITYYEGDDDEFELIEDEEEIEPSEEEQDEDIEPSEEAAAKIEESPQFTINLADISIVVEEDKEEESPEEVEVKSPEEPQQDKQTSSQAQPDIPKGAIDTVLFDLDTIPVRTKSRRSVILSLYSDGVPSTPTQPTISTPSTVEHVEEVSVEERRIEESKEVPMQESKEVPTQQEQPAQSQDEKPIDHLSVAPPYPDVIEIVNELIVDDQDEEEIAVVQTIAETLNSGVETIAERYASEQSQEDQNSSSTWQAIPLSSLNDRYIVTQELFGGDMEAFEKMMADINAIDDFDDCMIYIVENYDWNPEDDATKLILEFLEYKFSLN